MNKEKHEKKKGDLGLTTGRTEFLLSLEDSK